MWDGTSWGPKGQRWDKKIFPIMQDGARMGQNKTIQGGAEDSILGQGPSSAPPPPPPHCHPYLQVLLY